MGNGPTKGTFATTTISHQPQHPKVPQSLKGTSADVDAENFFLRALERGVVVFSTSSCVGACEIYPPFLPSPPRDRCWIPSRSRKGKRVCGGGKEGRVPKSTWKRNDEGASGKKGEKKLRESSSAFACGKSVGTVRCKVNGPENPLASCYRRCARWWTMASYYSIRFSYVHVDPRKKRETSTTGSCITWRVTDFGWKVTSFQTQVCEGMHKRAVLTSPSSISIYSGQHNRYLIYIGICNDILVGWSRWFKDASCNSQIKLSCRIEVSNTRKVMEPMEIRMIMI